MKSMAFKAIVKGGRAVVEELDEYPDGTVLEFEIAMTDAELARLDEALAISRAELQRGEGIPLDHFLAEWRSPQ